jgi:hypothetical protein
MQFKEVLGGRCMAGAGERQFKIRADVTQLR